MPTTTNPPCSGQKTVKSYDGQYHVVAITDPKANTTHYLYNGNSNLIQVTNPLGKYFTNTYDSLFRLTDVTDTLGHVAHTDFDAKHHPVKKTVSPATAVSPLPRSLFQRAITTARI